MSREFKLLLWFMLGIFIAAVPMFSYAETIPAKNGVVVGTAILGNEGNYDATCSAAGVAAASVYAGRTYTTVAELQADVLATISKSLTCGSGGIYYNMGLSSSGGSPSLRVFYKSTNGTVSMAIHIRYTSALSCPSGQSWTLSGTTCTRPDCPLGRKADGTCSTCSTLLLVSGACADTCTAGVQNTQFNKATTDVTASTYCGSNNCSKSVISKTPIATSCAFGAGGVGLCQIGFTVVLQTTGSYCDYGNGGTPNTNQPVADSNTNPCPAGYGSATSAGGFLRCLPPGTSTSSSASSSSSSTTPPGATTPTTTTNNTTNNTTCTVEGSCTTTTVTTVTDGAGAATSTTTTTTQDKSAFCAANPKNNACLGAGTVTPTGENGDGTAGDCDPTTQMCGSPGTGGLYTKKEKTITGVLTTFSDGFKASPVGNAVTGFFNVTVSGGSCPAWTARVDYLNTSIDMGQYFCNSTADRVMVIIGAVLMVVAAFTGFKWAVL